MLSSLLSAIAAPPADAFAEAQRHLDSLTKPPGSLGRLEEIAARLAVLRDGTPCVERPPGTPSMRRQGQMASQLHDSK